jgi:hypothetical protein
MFRRLFVVKLFLWRLTELGSGMFVVGGMKQVLGEGAVLAVATWCATLPRRSWPGTLIWLLWVSSRNLIIFPRTFNLNYLEWIILLILTVYPHGEPEEGEGPQRRWSSWWRPLADAPMRGGAEALAYRTIQVLLPITFVQSVLSKLFHGYWVGGDYLAYATFYGADYGGLPRMLRFVFGGLDAAFGGLGALPWARDAVFGPHAVDIPLWARVTILAFSWGVLIAEVGFPLLLISRRTRTVGVIGMMCTQVGIAGLAGLFTWGFAGLICETLYFPRRAVQIYRWILHGMLAFSVASLLDRRNIVDIFPYWFF